MGADLAGEGMQFFRCSGWVLSLRRDQDQAAGSTGTADFMPKEEASDTSAFHAQLLAALPALRCTPQVCKYVAA